MSSTRSHGRARGRSRGGFGKYLRARGRGHRGGGRPAEFQERVLLQGEQPEELDETEAKELEARYTKRTLGTNADRYEEPEPELGPDGTNNRIPPCGMFLKGYQPINRTTNCGTRSRFERVSGATTHGGSP